MTSSEALESLDATPDLLSDDERKFLDEQGYLPLGRILTDEETGYARERIDELGRIEGENAGQELHKEVGTVRLANLLEKDPAFEKFVTTPRVLAAITHVIGTSIQLSSLSSRASLPGHGQQGFHADWHEPVEPGNYFVCNAAWMIDDFSTENGGTRIIPGSHLRRQLPQDALSDRESDQLDQVNITGKAGSVVIFNSHLWHAGAENRTSAARRVVLSYFTRSDSTYIQNDHKELLSDETKIRLSKEALALAAAG
jgi:ectoine hydroxylase-related dioxygenase (phytanoyl-CoA dioxygenase family)